MPCWCVVMYSFSGCEWRALWSSYCIQNGTRCRNSGFLGMVREKIGERGAQWEDAWSVKYESTEPCCKQCVVNSNDFIDK